jgi:hypothetical protein
LPDKAKGALPKLADSLAERPELRLDIPAGPVTAADKEALDDAAFQAAIAQMRAGGRGAETPYEELDDKDKLDVLADLYRQEFGKKAEIPEAEALQSQRAHRESVAQLQKDVTLDEGVQGEIVLDAPPSDAVPTTLPPSAGTTGAAMLASSPPAEAPAKPTRRERKAAHRSNEVDWMEAQLRPRFRADATAADQLAKTRAAAVQEALLANGKIDPTRVFIDATKAAQDKDDKVRMELALE